MKAKAPPRYLICTWPMLSEIAATSFFFNGRLLNYALITSLNQFKVLKCFEAGLRRAAAKQWQVHANSNIYAIA
jgi:hypothetical protein